jgi:glycosyltransferase involved in cell wall biosynthesis
MLVPEANMSDAAADHPTPLISVIVPTRDRAVSLRLLLESLDALSPPSVPCEFVIADNGSTDETPRLLAEWKLRGPNRTVVRVHEPGKSRAVNAAITASRGELLAFLDDDVAVDREWLAAVWEYFATHDCAAAQGAVLWPREAYDDAELAALLERYRTIVHLDLSPDAVRTKLTGANMAVRRHAFAVVGTFNEKLGPGAAGLSEDNELADRILRHGGWIGYMARARVVHEVDRSRLTEEYFAEYHRRQGRSRFAYKHNRIFSSILPNLAKNAFNYALFGILGDTRKQYRAKGRLYHYGEMLRLARERSRAGRRTPARA